MIVWLGKPLAESCVARSLSLGSSLQTSRDRLAQQPFDGYGHFGSISYERIAVLLRHSGGRDGVALADWIDERVRDGMAGR